MNRPSKRQVRNSLATYDTLANGAPVRVEEPSRRTGPRGRQPESAVNDAVKEWARMRGGVLYRNRRGMVPLPNGAMLPIGLGPNGYGDVVGYLTIQITPAMVGRRVAVYTMLESKVRGGPEPHQQACIEEVRDAGGIAGCVTSAADCEVVLATWSARKP